jgi:hypothetical protein
MKHSVKRFESLAVALRELRPFVFREGHLATGRPFRSMGNLRSREAWANWLLCAAINKADGRSLTFSSDPVGGDGLIIDSATGDDVAHTEHVMVRSRHGRSEVDLGELILKAVRQKLAKGEAYARGKTLVVFLHEDVGNRVWFPNKVARELPQPLHFQDVWVVGFQAIDGAVYHVVHLDVSEGNAPTLEVRIANDFARWSVRRLQ